MSVRLLENKPFGLFVIIPSLVACLSLLTVPIHQKEPEQFTQTDKMIVTPDRLSHELAIERDYFAFAFYKYFSVLPYSFFYFLIDCFSFKRDRQ